MSRISIKQKEPVAYKAMLSVEQFMETPRIPPTLRELIKIRASQINGCANCIDMHTLEALKIGSDFQSFNKCNCPERFVSRPRRSENRVRMMSC